MKFNINRKQFISELRDVKKGSVKNVVPVKNNTVKIEAGLDNIHLTVYGDHSELVKTISGDSLKITNMGGVLIKLSLLIKILPKLLGNDITLATDTEDGNNYLIIITGETTFKIKAFSISAAPKDAKEPKNTHVSVNSNDFYRSLKGGLKTISKQNSRPILTGINFIVEHNKMAMVSTDSHQLFRSILNIQNPQNIHISTTVYGGDLTTFYRLMDKKGSDIRINLDNDFCTLIQDHLKITIKNIDGNYPGISQLIPQDFSTTFIINRLKLSKAVKQVKAISSLSRNNLFTFHYINNKSFLTAHGFDVGNVKTVLKPLKIDGKDIEINMNPDYVLNALNSYTGAKEVAVKFVSPLRPLAIEPVDDSNRLNLVTPIRTF